MLLRPPPADANDDADAASLREALALLGDWESELDALFAPATPPRIDPSPPSLSVLSKRPRLSEYHQRRNAHNNKLLELQTEAQELQHRLEQEHARLAQRAAAKEKTTRSALARECEEMAGRQKRQRVVAEADNAALRSAVAAQCELVGHLSKLVHKASVLSELVETKIVRKAAIAFFDGPTIAVPQHIRYLDCRMDEVGAVLSTGVFHANRGRDFHEVNFRDLGFDGLQVEFAVSWVVPFDAAAVEQALWMQMTGTHHEARSTDHQLTHATSDLLVSRFVSEPSPHGHHHGHHHNCNHGQPIAGITHGQKAARRYPPTHDGTRVFMTHIRARIFHEDGSPKGDMNGGGWFQVEPLPSKSTAATPEVSRVKWCRRVTGRPVDHDSTTSVERARWVRSIVKGPMHRHWQTNSSLFVGALETSLLT